jgi:hypothetical protein
VGVAVSAFAALEAARKAGDRAAEAAALVALAEETPLLSANFERAGWWLLEAQEIAADLGGLPEVEARALARFSALARRAGGVDEAREAATAAGDPVAQALAALDAQDADAARAALAVADTRGALGVLAAARLAALDDVEAGRALLASVPPADDPGDRYEQFVTMTAWSLLVGDVETAAAGSEEAMAIADALRCPHEVLVCGALAGVVRLFEGRGPAAVEALAGVIRAAGQMDPVWSDEDPPEGRGHPLLCLAGVRSARAAVPRLVRTGDARGRRGAAVDFVLCAMSAAAFRYAGGDTAGAIAVCDDVAATLVDRPALAGPLRRLGEAIRTAA